MSPSDAERVTGRVGVHLMAGLSIEVAGLEQAGAQPDRRIVRNSRVFDVKVEVHLLRSAIRPFGCNVVRC